MAVVGTNRWNAIAYGNGKYVAVGASGYVTTSTDGINWTTPTKAGTEEWSSVAFGNGKFVAVGRKMLLYLPMESLGLYTIMFHRVIC